MRAAWIALLAAGCTAGSLGDSGNTGGSALDDDSLSTGVIFKGPMSAGAEVVVRPLDDSGEPTGEEAVGVVALDDGSYSLAVAHTGLVQLIAVGTTLEEADGTLSADARPLVALGRLDGTSELQVNVITDLTHARAKALMGEGLDFDDAEAQANAELVSMIPVGVGHTPQALGRELSPYGASEDQGWLFAASAVLSNLGKQQGDLVAAMDGLRDDLTDDGVLTAGSVDALRGAVMATNPEVAQRALEVLLDDSGLERTIPDLNVALDSDLDAVPNHLDNCRYVPNEGQQDSAGLGFGDACDYRLGAVSTAAGYGCGLLGADGALRCWSSFEEPVSGAPPRPDAFPSAEVSPWLDDGVSLPTPAADLAVADHAACVLGEDGGAACWFEGEPVRALPGSYTALAASADLACAERLDGGVDCIGADGGLVVSVADPVRSFAIIDGALCSVDEDSGALSCQDDGGVVTLAEQPSGAFASVAGSGIGWGCAITEADGALACFGDGVLGGVPSGAGFVEVAVGAEVACATDAYDVPQCWSATSCELGEVPPAIRDLSAAGCRVCGIDPDGLGACWPQRYAFE